MYCRVILSCLLIFARWLAISLMWIQSSSDAGKQINNTSLVKGQINCKTMWNYQCSSPDCWQNFMQMYINIQRTTAYHMVAYHRVDYVCV